jgi:hypothetical protein
MTNTALSIRDSANPHSAPLPPNENHEYRPCLPKPSAKQQGKAQKQFAFPAKTSKMADTQEFQGLFCIDFRTFKGEIPAISKPSKLSFCRFPNLARSAFNRFFHRNHLKPIHLDSRSR